MASDKNTHNLHNPHRHHNSLYIDQDGLVLVNRLNQSRSPYVGLSCGGGRVIQMSRLMGVFCILKGPGPHGKPSCMASMGAGGFGTSESA